eukprot:CAMPEP_0117578020 /NCGR_PEP_ID=MMETSP0784-20121206/63759_1 /TAXON_ID=39447 /ORGANISM="" /LENGTH=45 /DNA_ID= /DNA_START= /DNA_END= /DNA_ORIENTATION=
MPLLRRAAQTGTRAARFSTAVVPASASSETLVQKTWRWLDVMGFL